MYCDQGFDFLQIQLQIIYYELGITGNKAKFFEWHQKNALINQKWNNNWKWIASAK